MTQSDDDLTKLVNASGFALQLGLEHRIKQREDGHPWRLVSREHPWASQQGSGFIDLVLSYGYVTGVVECKRTRGGTWVFLVPDGEETERIATRVLWVAGTQDGRAISGFDVVELQPASPISPFCTVRGSGENDRPLLERLCATLLASADALAEEEVGIVQRNGRGWKGFYLPILVTTAELHVCRLAPEKVDLATGTLEDAQFERVPFIRFQKAFQTDGRASETVKDLSTAAQARERTVCVVEAKEFTKFLAQVERPQFGEPLPWVKPLATLERSA